MNPVEVRKKKPQVWINLCDNRLKNPQTVSQRSRFSPGDLVRISIERGPFKKDYLEGQSEEIFVAKHAVGNSPTVYKSQDQVGEDLFKGDPEGY